MAEPERVCSRCGSSYAPDVFFCPADGTRIGGQSKSADDPYLGLELARRFVLTELRGTGSTGRVYRARDTMAGTDVAVKVLHRELLHNRAVFARFHREAAVVSRLTHPHIVQVLASGEVESRGHEVGGEAYLVMEYLDGISLRAALEASGKALPVSRALHVVLQLCDALGEAHARGVVHRDLKPENVMLVRAGRDADFVKVLDFGLARADLGDDGLATRTGAVLGTASYISPEGAQGQRVGPAADVYALAVILFECLAGAPPFSGENLVSVLLKHTSEEPPDVRSFQRAAHVPPGLAAAIRQNLAKDPNQRCANARELGRALTAAASESAILGATS